MALEKEARTNIMGSSLDIRNRNWGKVDDHMLETVEDDVHGLSGAVIVESGSNARGRYVKYGDGTMICYGTEPFTNVAVNISTGALFGSGNLRWTYPLPFVGNPDVSMTPIAGTRRLWGQASIIDATSVVFLLTGTESITLESINISLMAIGRWK